LDRLDSHEPCANAEPVERVCVYGWRLGERVCVCLRVWRSRASERWIRIYVHRLTLGARLSLIKQEKVEWMEKAAADKLADQRAILELNNKEATSSTMQEMKESLLAKAVEEQIAALEAQKATLEAAATKAAAKEAKALRREAKEAAELLKAELEAAHAEAVEAAAAKVKAAAAAEQEAALTELRTALTAAGNEEKSVELARATQVRSLNPTVRVQASLPCCERQTGRASCSPP